MASAASCCVSRLVHLRRDCWRYLLVTNLPLIRFGNKLTFLNERIFNQTSEAQKLV